VLDTHDGIGVIDVGAGSGEEAGLLPPNDIERLVEAIHARSNGQSQMATGGAANNLDLYQVNCTFFDALGCRDNEYLIARAIQFFVPGTPQVYYVGLFAGMNDMELLARSRVGRDINRHYYTSAEVQASLEKPVVRRLMDLMRVRNSHPAFSGNAQVETPSAQRLAISWENAQHWAKLAVNLEEMRAVVTYSDPRDRHGMGTWDSHTSAVASEVVR
jgi:sucrose phosphorylase